MWATVMKSEASLDDRRRWRVRKRLPSPSANGQIPGARRRANHLKTTNSFSGSRSKDKINTKTGRTLDTPLNCLPTTSRDSCRSISDLPPHSVVAIEALRTRLTNGGVICITAGHSSARRGAALRTPGRRERRLGGSEDEMRQMSAERWWSDVDKGRLHPETSRTSSSLLLSQPAPELVTTPTNSPPLRWLVKTSSPIWYNPFVSLTTLHDDGSGGRRAATTTIMAISSTAQRYHQYRTSNTSHATSPWTLRVSVQYPNLSLHIARPPPPSLYLFNPIVITSWWPNFGRREWREYRGFGVRGSYDQGCTNSYVDQDTTTTSLPFP
ncbi:hypothetical protein BDN72DRAFT_864500 [Pluteus cervinus]|uniref:Uncharacterized protein n=1 Tax=Pluteus cervinus TaxID=181527 RepID=A0ACD3A3N3_9AGAR|nr:hypothetical protein BDN72DRAFT_864500 [Pluteus cervinus]